MDVTESEEDAASELDDVSTAASDPEAALLVVAVGLSVEGVVSVEVSVAAAELSAVESGDSKGVEVSADVSVPEVSDAEAEVSEVAELSVDVSADESEGVTVS